MLDRERERFFKRTTPDQNGCLNWTGTISKQGYPMFYTEHDKSTFAHRAIYEDYHGRIRGDLRIIKTCGNKICVNPDHLELGDCRDVYHNEQKLGRNWVHRRYGEENNASKLTNSQVLKIRELYATKKYRMLDLALQFGVSQALVSLIISRKRWRQLES